MAEKAPNIGIVTAYNDMLSAHAPLQHYPDLIKAEARKHGATVQVAGFVEKGAKVEIEVTAVIPDA